MCIFGLGFVVKANCWAALTTLTVVSFGLYGDVFEVEGFFLTRNFPAEIAFSILQPATTTSEKLAEGCPMRCEKNGSSRVLMNVKVKSLSGNGVVILAAMALQR